MTWPNWDSMPAVVVGTGPSAARVDLSPARQADVPVIVIKSAWRLAPWADILYGIDPGWWDANAGAPGFRGTRMSPSPQACERWGLTRVHLSSVNRVLMGATGLVGTGSDWGGGHSGFQVMNLAAQFGARRILMVGYDMHLDDGDHWTVNDPGVGPADAGRVRMWRDEMDAAAIQFKALGIEVVNCSPGSHLTSYPHFPLREVLRWA